MLANKSIFLRIASALPFLLLLIGLAQPALAQSKVALQLHNINVQQGIGSASYDVSVYFSLFDSARNPIKDASLEDFTVSEENQLVKIANRANNPEVPGSDEKTLIARANNEPPAPSPADKTITPGGNHA